MVIGARHMRTEGTAMSFLDQLDEEPKVHTEPAQPAVPTGVLNPRQSPVLAELDAIIQLQLTWPFESPRELGLRCRPPKTARYIAAITGSAAYRLLYEQRRKEMGIALGLPNLLEEIDGATRVVLHKVVDRVENSDDGYLAVAAFNALAKARGTGGHAPAKPTQIFVDARQAAIMEVRDRAMDSAREQGPYPPEASLGQSPHQPMPVLLGPAGQGPVPEFVPDPPPASEDPTLAELEAELDALPGAEDVAEVGGPSL